MCQLVTKKHSLRWRWGNLRVPAGLRVAQLDGRLVLNEFPFELFSPTSPRRTDAITGGIEISPEACAKACAKCGQPIQDPQLQFPQPERCLGCSEDWEGRAEADAEREWTVRVEIEVSARTPIEAAQLASEAIAGRDSLPMQYQAQAEGEIAVHRILIDPSGVADPQAVNVKAVMS